MTAYLVRRLLYAVPILLGVNLITFVLFFFVNTPDHMARAHLGTKRVTAEQIHRWKRERGYHLPTFYNPGWREAGFCELRGEEVVLVPPSRAPGRYRLRVEASRAAAGTLAVELRTGESGRLELEAGAAAPRVVLDLASDRGPQILFRLASPREDPPSLTVSLHPSPGASGALVFLEFRESLSAVERFTETIFWRKSVGFLFLQFGHADDGRHIGTEIRRRIGPSLTLMVPIFLVGILVQVTIAMMLAFCRGTALDFWGSVAAVILMSTSILFLVIGGQWLLATRLKLVPVSGYDSGLEAWKFVILPVVIGVAGGLGSGVRWYRTIFLEEMGKDYVRTARAKGLPEGAVLYRHVLKNAMIPILTGVVVVIPFLFIGSLVLESFFAIPGMGSFTLEAIQRQDFAIVQAMVFLGSALYIAGLMLTDISYTLVDPRVRLG